MIGLYLEELPDLPPPTPFLLAALLLTFWLTMRIRILRRRQERREEGDAPVKSWAWLRALAATTWILPLLAGIATLLAIAIVATFL